MGMNMKSGLGLDRRRP